MQKKKPKVYRNRCSRRHFTIIHPLSSAWVFSSLCFTTMSRINLSSCSFPLSKTFTFLASYLAPYLGGTGSTREMLSAFQAVPGAPGPEKKSQKKPCSLPPCLSYAQGRQNIWDKNYQTLGKPYTDVAD